MIFIDGQWQNATGESFQSLNPATGQSIWRGCAASNADVTLAINSAQRALPLWAKCPIEQRTALLLRFASLLRANQNDLALTISQETGKPLWESLTEVGAMVSKVAVSIEAYQLRCHPQEVTMASGRGITRYKPHGIVAVLGPFNFPGHVPNGHLVPALLAGNVALFKPSEKTPWVGQKMVELWQQAGLPKGVLNLLQGAGPTGQAMVHQPAIKGIYFTGGCSGGDWLSQIQLKHPGRILALELGGNNPLVVGHCAQVQQAAYGIVQSAYITAGQRCTCARRLIVPRGSQGDDVIIALLGWIKKLRVGPYTMEPAPFAGPVIDAVAGQKILAAQDALPGETLAPCQAIDDNLAMLTPGLVDMTGIENRRDEEYFGPLLQLIRTDDFDAAITEANNTAFGLAASLFSDDEKQYEQFYEQVNAGLINWNKPTTGASGKLPFGGIGKSGNFRPAGFFAADYCSYPVASIEAKQLAPVPSQSKLIGFNK